jgi:hypothetical protein
MKQLRDQKGSTLDHFVLFSNYFFKSLLENMALENWCDIETKYFDELKTVDEKEDYRNNPTNLNDQFHVLEEYLSEYLKTQSTHQSIESYRVLFDLINSSDTLIINFNYTDTLKRLYGDSILNSKVIHLHGELEYKDNPIIFGYAAIEEDMDLFRKKGSVEYMRNIKQIRYKRTSNEKTIIQYLEDTEEINISIFGHSCGLSDNLILRNLFCNPKVVSIRIFYYKEYEYYLRNQCNMEMIMNGNPNIAKLRSFDTSSRMPQHDDDVNQYEMFNKYIYRMVEEQQEANPLRYLGENTVV